jgi:hypothetical protein
MPVTFESFEAALSAKSADEMVSGTYIGDRPVYFVMSETATDDLIRDAAFEIREGRPPSKYEELLLAQAKLIAERPLVPA